VEGYARSASLVPEPTPPPPNINFMLYDLECVNDGAEEYVAKEAAKQPRNELPDPNKTTNEVRMISCIRFGHGVEDNKEGFCFVYKSPYKTETVVHERGETYTVVPFTKELDMIMAFFDYVRLHADVVVGYNNHLFDLPYLIVRVDVLTMGHPPCRLLVLGVEPWQRFDTFYSVEEHAERSVIKECRQRRAISPHAVGIIYVDLMQLLLSGKFGAFKSLKLRDTSREILCKESKDPLTYSDIFDALHQVMSASRFKEIWSEIDDTVVIHEVTQKMVFDLVMHYCYLDSWILMEMILFRNMWGTLCSTSFMECVPFQRVCDRKSKLLVTTEHEWRCFDKGLLLNKRYRTNPMPKTEDGKSFQGGVVLEAEKGLHACCPDTCEVNKQGSIPEEYLEAIADLAQYLPQEAATNFFLMGLYLKFILTLDLQSMYPSIMRKWNMSPDTLKIPDARLYPCEEFDKRIQGKHWLGNGIGVPVIPKDTLLSLKEKPGYWPDGPMNDKYNAFVIPSPVVGVLPRVLFFVKPEFYEGVYNIMVTNAFNSRVDRKDLMKALKIIKQEALTLSGGALERVPDHRKLMSLVNDRLKREATIDCASIMKELGMSSSQIAGAADVGVGQADSEQSVLKVINNAMYGANGYVQKSDQDRAPNPTECLEVAAAVTAVGRAMNKEMEDALCGPTAPPSCAAVNMKRVIGDTDSVIVKITAQSLKHAFDIAKEHAKRITDEVWGADGVRNLEVDGVCTAAYISGRKNRCELLYEKDGEKPKRKIAGMCPKKVNEPFVKRDPIQSFCDLVMNIGAMRISGFRLILIYELHKCFERLLLPPHEGGYTVKDYATSTFIGQTNNTKTPHLVALSKRCKRQGVPLNFYKGQYMSWVTIMGDGNASLRTEDADVATWEMVDRLYAFTNTVGPITKKTLVEKPWVEDNTPILSPRVWNTIDDAYKGALMRQTSKLFSRFSTKETKEPTREDRLALFVNIFMEENTLQEQKIVIKKHTTKSIASFFTKKPK
jgi:DNA polymerase elongation subunit (family B)